MGIGCVAADASVAIIVLHNASVDTTATILFMLVLPFGLREMSLPQNDCQACAATVVANRESCELSMHPGAEKTDISAQARFRDQLGYRVI
jgi:hypothetical protein